MASVRKNIPFHCYYIAPQVILCKSDKPDRCKLGPLFYLLSSGLLATGHCVPCYCVRNEYQLHYQWLHSILTAVEYIEHYLMPSHGIICVSNFSKISI